MTDTIKTGIPEFDRRTGGLRPGELLYIEAEQGAGLHVAFDLFSKGFKDTGRSVVRTLVTGYVTSDAIHERLCVLPDHVEVLVVSELPQDRVERGATMQLLNFVAKTSGLAVITGGHRVTDERGLMIRDTADIVIAVDASQAHDGDVVWFKHLKAQRYDFFDFPMTFHSDKGGIRFTPYVYQRGETSTIFPAFLTQGTKVYKTGLRGFDEHVPEGEDEPLGGLRLGQLVLLGAKDGVGLREMTAHMASSFERQGLAVAHMSRVPDAGTGVTSDVVFVSLREKWPEVTTYARDLKRLAKKNGVIVVATIGGAHGAKAFVDLALEWDASELSPNSYGGLVVRVTKSRDCEPFSFRVPIETSADGALTIVTSLTIGGVPDGTDLVRSGSVTQKPEAPDARCVTTADGGCEAESCMHTAPAPETPEERFRKASIRHDCGGPPHGLEAPRERADVRIVVEVPGCMPTRAHENDACYDLYSAEEVVEIPAGKVAAIYAGIRLGLPDTWEAQVRPRSGNSRRNLRTAFGTIDEAYNGRVYVNLSNDTEETVFVHKHDRVGQLAVRRVPDVRFVVVDDPSKLRPQDGPDARGSRGFGSSGGNVGGGAPGLNSGTDA